MYFIKNELEFSVKNLYFSKSFLYQKWSGNNVRRDANFEKLKTFLMLRLRESGVNSDSDDSIAIIEDKNIP